MWRIIQWEMNSVIEYFGAKPVSQEKPKAIERTPSGTKKWVKELSPLANNVVGRCARFEFLFLLRYFLILAKPEAVDIARIDARFFFFQGSFARICFWCWQLHEIGSYWSANTELFVFKCAMLVTLRNLDLVWQGTVGPARGFTGAIWERSTSCRTGSR